MSRESASRKTYEARVVEDSLKRLATKLDVNHLPFSEVELQTLAKRARQWFRAYRSDSKRERLTAYKTHLSTLYDEEAVELVWGTLEQINNEIGYEEK